MYKSATESDGFQVGLWRSPDPKRNDAAVKMPNAAANEYFAPPVLRDAGPVKKKKRQYEKTIPTHSETSMFKCSFY